MTWENVIHFAVKGNPEPPYRVDKTDEEWKEVLSSEDYFVTRLKGTERPFSGEYCTSHSPGIYGCKCCNTPLFDANEKFESGTGWPSFTVPVADNVIGYIKDTSYGMVRVEVVCNICDAHLGHVFPDGPEPTGLRYCINSASVNKLS